MSTKTELESRILDNPDDSEAWAVYADWLAAQGSSRGRLATAQRALEASADEALQAEVNALLADPELAPPLLMAELETHRQAEPDASNRWQYALWRASQPIVQWRCGHIVSTRLSKVDPDNKDVRLLDLVRELVHHDSARFLHELRIGPLGEYDEYDYRGVVEVLGEASLSGLHELFVAEFVQEQSEMSWSSLGDLSGVWKAAPNLRTVTVRGGEFTLGTLDLPLAKVFQVRTGGLAAANLESIAGASWPALERLELWFGSHFYGATCTIEHVRQLLETERMPQLRDLGLMNAEFSDDMVDAVVQSAVARRLKRLDLSMGTLSNQGAARLAQAGQAAFPELTQLSIARNYVDADHVERLMTSFPEAQVDAMRQGNPDRDDFYVTVGE